MSNARRHHRDHQALPGASAHPPEGRIRRFFWKWRRWLGIS